MTIILSPEDSQRWEAGGWLSLEIQETVIEDLDRQQCHEVVAVCLADGTVIFWVADSGVI